MFMFIGGGSIFAMGQDPVKISPQLKNRKRERKQQLEPAKEGNSKSQASLKTDVPANGNSCTGCLATEAPKAS